ncbi:MAG: ModE family transcriptional regulator [Candidatus Lokiarchaeota archaeon]|nr:ModE family transcriptional regulator [Candidatus Lokiarchaeota archaeon]MBD3199547.1 ModE family transcriptional regulator [Candidatus Lokiarchaeota archaeon]
MEEESTKVASVRLDELKPNVDFGIKIWLEFDGKNILGQGWAKLLEYIRNNESEKGSLTKAAKQCGYSYKYAWNILKRIEKRTGKAAVITSKGGSGGGGWIKLNDWGEYLLQYYQTASSEVEEMRIRIKNILNKSN